ncbi:MAG TPA: thiamine pyrophosphate-binding protein [Synergistales bacterium]|nr:thiamine pyrophosphate-binding protein [Synergistales bacterium]HRV71585.1 thiamine pyrophosphate-binding protein [Thermovirgaceae bacterium]
MKAARALLEMLRGYGVEYVFGLPGETTLGLYNEWKQFEGIEHVMARDERHAVFMADGYARVSGKPGVCEAPSVGATHMIPGIVEAMKSCVPLIAITSDIPLHMEKHNMLTGFDQTALFAPFVKESLTAFRGDEIPFLVQRAFRVAVSGCPGPVHLRLPMDVLTQEISSSLPQAQFRFAQCPGTRPVAEHLDVEKAARALAQSKKGVMICGQGTLTSKAWDEVKATAETFGLAVGTTINGKGSIPEMHPLSIGVIGARGSTHFSNSFLEEADLVFFVGSSTDSVGTNGGILPGETGKIRFIHLNISEKELGNSFGGGILLHGDVKSTLRAILDFAEREALPAEDRQKDILDRRSTPKRRAFGNEGPIDPRAATEAISELMPEKTVIVADPGMSAVYPAAFWKIPEAGRFFLTNFAMGALGYGLPAAIGASCALPEGSTVLNFMGDGSFGFVAGEMETLARLGKNIKVILFNNSNFGWIRGTNHFSFGGPDFSPSFSKIDYVMLADSFGIKSYRASTLPELNSALEEFFADTGPAFLEMVAPSPEECVPPVPDWASKAKESGRGSDYW